MNEKAEQILDGLAANGLDVRGGCPPRLDARHERAALLDYLRRYPDPTETLEREAAYASSMIQASIHGASHQTAFSDWCAATFRPGDHVEVNIIIAATPEAPERRWIGGQVVIREEGGGVRVRDLRPGTFHGCEFWHRRGTVRPAGGAR